MAAPGDATQSRHAAIAPRESRCEMTGKVFGIGLSRTATRSLNRALEALGYRSVHLPRDRKTYEELSSGIYTLSILARYDGITDITAAPFYARFDEAYPGSKFILTTREKSSWMESMRELNRVWLDEAKRGAIRRYLHRLRLEWRYERRPIGSFYDPADHIRMIRFLRTAVYGGLAFTDERRLSDVYDQHHGNVREYFRSRPNDLLVMDICGGEGWAPLCRFLAKREPSVPFPHTDSR
jgi:hypothetical protein